jgi:hypothetical protein
MPRGMGSDVRGGGCREGRDGSAVNATSAERGDAIACRGALLSLEKWATQPLRSQALSGASAIDSLG